MGRSGPRGSKGSPTLSDLDHRAGFGSGVSDRGGMGGAGMGGPDSDDEEDEEEENGQPRKGDLGDLDGEEEKPI